jgi:hypothetical protein
MAPHVLVRVDGDVYAHPLSRSHPLASPQTEWVRGAPGDDLDSAIDYLIRSVALPDVGNAVHAAIVDASDAGAARLMAPLWWVSPHEIDDDSVADTARALGLDPEDPRIAHVTMVAVSLTTVLDRFHACTSCGGDTDHEGSCQQSCEPGAGAHR